MRGAAVDAAGELRRGGLHDGGVVVAEQQRAMATEVVDVFVAVHVPLVCSHCAVHAGRVRLQIPGHVRDAAGQHCAYLTIELR